MKIIIAVAGHKPAPVPEDPIYLPVQAGADGRPPILMQGKSWQQDDAGENISSRNSRYCEMTVHYWLRHNVTADVYGLCHYRRYFAGKRFGAPLGRLLTAKAIRRQLECSDMILPKKRHYWIETNESQYAHAHHLSDLMTARAVLLEMYGDTAAAAFDRVMKRRSGHRFNMLIMKKEPFFAYSDWLFPALQEIEKRIDFTGYDEQETRVIGFLAERLLDVWLEICQPSFTECPVVHTESQHWIRKIAAFLRRKVTGHR